MHEQRGPDRRQSSSGPPAGMAERRCGSERRTLNVTRESIADVETRLAMLARRGRPNSDDNGSGWDKLIIPVD